MESINLLVICFYFQVILSLPTPEPSYPQISPIEINNLKYEEHHEEQQNVEEVNVEKVIEEVQTLLSNNPTLPRLTRGEIVELLENITSNDESKRQIQNSLRDQKAIMLVMPYTPGNGNSDAMAELYTKPPVTRIIGNDTSENYKAPEIMPKDPPIFKPTKKNKLKTEDPYKNQGYSLKSEITQKRKPEANIRDIEIRKVTIATTTTPTTTNEAPTTSKPIPSRKPTHRHEVRRRPATHKPLKLEEITYKPHQIQTRKRPTKSPQRHPNHKYPDEEKYTSEKESISNQGIHIVSPPKFIARPLDIPKLPKNSSISSTSSSILTESTEKPSDDILKAINIPENMKNIVKDIDVLVENPFPNKFNKPIFQLKQPLEENVFSTFALKDPTTTTSTIIPDVSQMTDNLSPDMKNLLMSFGLIPDPNYKPIPIEEESLPYKQEADITRDSYVSFKPLPQSAPSRKDMEEFLAEFGLGGPTRDSKAIPMKSNKNQINFDVVPDSHKYILDDIGLTKNAYKQELIAEESNMVKQHVFNPNDNQNATPEELDRLEKLLDMIKQLEQLNTTENEENLKKINMGELKDLVDTFNQPKFVPLNEKNAPNPLNYDASIIKNEVKRQEASNAPTTISSTTEQPRNLTLIALEESFGGLPETTSEAAPETTTAKRTGFYYLLDWNSFFDIDNQKGKRVNLRLQPKVGDPRNFLSVSVP